MSSKLTSNPLIQTLFRLKISDESDLLPFYPRVRDRKGIKVLRSKKSGLVILDKVSHIDFDYYENNVHYVQGKHEIETNKGVIKTTFLDDASRRVGQYGKYLKNKKVLDFGCGRGEFLYELGSLTQKRFGVEPNKRNREQLISDGIICYRELNAIPLDQKFDFIFLNHVYHHLLEPIEMLKKLKQHLNENGSIILEVRHGNDFLIEHFQNKAYLDFAFCSEHLILHSEKSLEKFCKEAGFKNTKVHYFQRYPVSNHYHWFINHKPGGHDILKFLNDEKLNFAYKNYLIENKLTDTLIAVLSKGEISKINNTF